MSTIAVMIIMIIPITFFTKIKPPFNNTTWYTHFLLKLKSSNNQKAF